MSKEKFVIDNKPNMISFELGCSFNETIASHDPKFFERFASIAIDAASSIEIFNTFYSRRTVF